MCRLAEDRGNKWQHHQLIPSVSQSQPRVECYRRLGSGAWEYRVSEKGTAQLESGAVLDLAALYDDLPD
jgi:hypothetical protein